MKVCTVNFILTALTALFAAVIILVLAEIISPSYLLGAYLTGYIVTGILLVLEEEKYPTLGSFRDWALMFVLLTFTWPLLGVLGTFRPRK